MKPKVNKLYALIHQDYNRLGQIGDKSYWFLNPDSYQNYLSMRQEQNKVVSKIANDENSALIVFPYVLGFFNDYYQYLPNEERNLLETQLHDISEWARALDDRFLLITDDDFESRQVPRWRKYLLKDKRRSVTWLKEADFASKFPFTFSPKEVELYAFGEYASDCVSIYGEAVCRSLSIPEKNFTIIHSASIENIQLMHESEREFFQHLPGWRK